MPLLLAFALVLSEIDRFDLRCVWVSESAAQQAKPDQREVIVRMASWFAGRVAGRQPGLGVNGYVQQNFVFEAAKATDSDLRTCADVFSAWQLREVEGAAHQK